MTTANESEASPDAASSSFGLPGGASDTDDGPVLCENDRNTPSLDANLSLTLRGGKPLRMEGRGVYRLVIGIVAVLLAILTEARRGGLSASFAIL